MTETLISPTLLFRFAAPCLHTSLRWTAEGVALPESCRLPSLAVLHAGKQFADVRMAWNEEQLLVNVTVRGKQQPPWCRDSRIDDSDGVQLFIDTRNTQNIHRAGRFCHRIAFLPAGTGRNLEEPLAVMLAINRAKESPREIEPRQLAVISSRQADGYSLAAAIPSGALTGYNPAEHPALGFSYAVIDRELGWQTFSVGPELPFTDNPSLWGTLDLVRA